MATARPRSARTVAVAAGILTSALLLTGCGAIIDSITGPSEAQRDEPGGEVTAASDADVFSLQVGDCINQSDTVETEETVEYESLPVVPCADPHTGEVYAEHELPAGDFPGDQAVTDTGMEHCYSVFEEFVGLSYEESTLDFWAMFPSQQGWEMADDRTVQCFVGPVEDTVTGTLEGAAV